MTTRYIGAMPKLILRQPALVLLMLAAFAACRGDQAKQQTVAQSLQPGEQAPDEVPKMLNTEPPFRYPAALYARKVQGNVTLRLRIDTKGRALPDSTRVETKSDTTTLPGPMPTPDTHFPSGPPPTGDGTADGATSASSGAAITAAR